MGLRPFQSRLPLLVALFIGLNLVFWVIPLQRGHAAQTTNVPVVVNGLIDNPPFSGRLELNSTRIEAGSPKFLTVVAADNETGQLRIVASVKSESGVFSTVEGGAVSQAGFKNAFHIVRSGSYRVSWYFEIHGFREQRVSAGGIGKSVADGALWTIASVFRNDDQKLEWQSGLITLDSFQDECRVAFAEDICGYLYKRDDLNFRYQLVTPWLKLTAGEYSWTASLEAVVDAYANEIATTALGYSFNVTDPLFATKLGQFHVEDACPDYLSPTSSALFAGSLGDKGWYRSPIVVSLSAVDGPLLGDCSNPYGVDRTLYRVDGGSWGNYSGPFTISADGRHNLEFYSIDKAGNSEDPKSLNLMIDSASPAGVLHINNDATYTSSRYVSLAASATDGPQGSGDIQVIFRNAGGSYSDWQPFSTGLIPWTLSSGDGNKSVCVQFKDNAGNIATENCANVFLDTTPPSTPSPQVQVNTRNGTTTFSWYRSTDAGSGVAGYIWRVDAGNEKFTTSGSVNLPSLVGERHVFYVRAEDNAGLLSSWGSVPFGANAPTGPASLLGSMLNSSSPWMLIPTAFAAGLVGIVAYRRKAKEGTN